MKRIVHYVKGTLLNDIAVGKGAFVIPMDHPGQPLVSNTQHVYTSNVLQYDPSTGVFETLNSLYIPKTKGT